MSPKRGDRVAPPADPTGGWELRFATTDAVKGGKRCVSRRRRTPSPRGTSCAPAPRHRHRPRDTINSKALATAAHGGTVTEQWQYEVTAGGRLWYLVDTARRTLWIKAAGTAHPKSTE